MISLAFIIFLVPPTCVQELVIFVVRTPSSLAGISWIYKKGASTDKVFQKFTIRDVTRHRHSFGPWCTF